VSFEARRADELATMLGRHGAGVLRAPALREAALEATPEAVDAARRIVAGETGAVILLTGVGTKAWAAAVGGAPLVDALGRVPIVLPVRLLGRGDVLPRVQRWTGGAPKRYTAGPVSAS
jgi:uroporphyrinogen-III synthase